MLEIELACRYTRSFDELLKAAIVHPVEKISTVLDGTLKEIYLWEKPMIWCKHNPAAVQAI
jgi:hypothetical protein